MINNDTTGFPKHTGENVSRVLGGENDLEVVVCSGIVDVVPTMQNCRGIRADGSSSSDGYFTAKLERKTAAGVAFVETLTLTIGQVHPITNVTKVFVYTTGTTKLTSSAWVVSGEDDETSTLTAASIKLVR